MLPGRVLGLDLLPNLWVLNWSQNKAGDKPYSLGNLAGPQVLHNLAIQPVGLSLVALLLSVLLLVAGKGRARDNEPLINQSTSSGSSVQYDGEVAEGRGTFYQYKTVSTSKHLTPSWLP